jgi:hypothetical protein
MNREDARKLVGGYATGTLTPEEQRALFEAALEDQELFDELSREQALRDLLADPAARGSLIAVLEEPVPQPWYRRRWFLPALAAAVPAVALVAALLVWPARQKPVEIAMVQAPPPAPTLPQPALEAPRLSPAPAPEADTRVKALDAAPPPARQMAAEEKLADRAPVPEPREARADAVRLRKEVAAPEAPRLTAATGELGRAGGGGGAAPAVANLAAPPQPPAPGAQALFFGAVQQQAADSAEQAKGSGPSQIRTQQQQQLRMATGAATAVAPPNIGVGYTILRRVDGNQYTPVTELARADTAAVRLVPNARGRLTVTAISDGASRVLLSADVAPMNVYQTPDLREGESRISVVFTREQQGRLDRTGTRNLVETTAGETTYVVSAPSTPPAAEVSFQITLQYR